MKEGKETSGPQLPALCRDGVTLLPSGSLLPSSMTPTSPIWAGCGSFGIQCLSRGMIFVEVKWVWHSKHVGSPVNYTVSCVPRSYSL